jgi:hypothetical protein
MPDGHTDSARPRLIELRNGLLRLHKTLLDSEAAAYQHDVARIRSNTHLLELVLNDPWFAWLHELSGLVVLIDEALDGREPPTAEDAARFIDEAAVLLTPAENGAGFRKHYFHGLQRDPDVVLAHAAMMKTLASLRARIV